MGIVYYLPDHRHGRASASKPKSDRSADVLRLANSRSKMKNLSVGSRPRAFQLDTAGSDTPMISAAADGPPRASTTSSTVRSMPPYSSPYVNMSSVHALGMVFRRPGGNTPGMPPSAKTLGKRLQLTREALGVRAVDICRALDIAPNRWSQYENGERPITMAVAVRLCEVYGLTLDWIYRGDPSGLPVRLHQKLSVTAA